ncbi:MAG: tRNA pseudouridine(55) synthase TruB [Cetobacterium somerae]|uniref:tRNA pseudouridine synthase B n=1 Tax=Cetobacterium somerae ATCC BAA-474 TaxID=1319815 RepID=U7V7T7_9FUSO|nr:MULTISPECIES: tRNA pseudouridine(55) synthase TruB [Cetobacterium]ERT67620.1 tRNA pseudouridine synthase B [Cetobacterium somerae ATCC BAA-474]MCQ8212513.1 tRNA pseudouridine(55) synthase TruB [Cetobacterium sp. NK01]MCQ9625586.1 tRNA pseudouridine(55) synthase TruB [Cetobacterium somerae]WVJ00311.1 tRNA pseudouridine(55) synthase TruB [Cetobacterium somerae]
MEGIIVIDKPIGITSFDVIRVLRRNLKERRIGHTGTLDPLATGILVICVGKATKLAQDIEGYEKEYVADLELGFKTDTYDIEGKVLAKVEEFNISYENFEETLETFKGDIKQIPPMYSAIKVDGKKLYELAREGVEIERKARDVSIKNLETISFDGVKAKIDCTVSKGTYIRSLIYDLGEKLGTFATMTGLRRTRVGEEDLARAFTLETIEKMVSENDFSFLVSIEDYFKFPKVDIEDENDLKLFVNGQRCKKRINEGKYRVYSKNNFIGLGEVTKGLLKGYKYY